MKKPFSIGIAWILCLLTLSGIAFAGSEEPGEEISESMLTEQALYEAAEEDIVGAASAGQYGGVYSDGATVSIGDLSAYSHLSRFSGYNISKGIDVSEFQGNIDWAEAKEAGVEFVIIRIGGRFAQSGNLYEDYRFDQNIQGALAQGIKVGVYYFSQAVNTTEAEEEAEATLDILGSYKNKLSLPVYLDVEYVNNGGRLKSAGLSKAEQTKVAKAYCAAIEEAGLEAGVYASFTSFDIDADAIADAGYEVWQAQWSSSASAYVPFTTWQFSAKGSVDGVPTDVDLDFRYELPESGFTDVKSGSWYFDNVVYVVEKGLFNGVGNNKFQPDTAMTREMFVTVLHRLAGLPAAGGSFAFSDVTNPDSWYYNAIVWGKTTGIVNGVSEESFGVGNKLKRQEMVTLLYRYANENEMVTETPDVSSLDSFYDADKVSSWAKEAMAWAVSEGIISGMEGKDTEGRKVMLLSPTGISTRAQVAAVIQRMNEK